MATVVFNILAVTHHSFANLISISYTVCNLYLAVVTYCQSTIAQSADYIPLALRLGHL